MIILYKGARGRGKTLTMVKDGYIYYEEGYRILSNFHVSYAEYISNKDILNLNKDSELYDCVLMIDEIQIFFDSRRGMRKENLTFSNFIQQARKRNIILLITTQYSNTIDNRIRQHLDMLAFPNFIKKYDVCEVTYMDLTRFEDVISILGETEVKPLTIKIIFDARPFFKMYNTSEMII